MLPAAISGTVVDVHGVPLRGWTVEASGPPGTRSPKSVITGPDGGFVFTSCTHAEHVVGCASNGNEAMQHWRGVMPGGEALVLRVSPEYVPDCFLHGTIAAETTTQVSVATDSGRQLDSRLVPPGGSFRFGPLVAGRCTLQTLGLESGAGASPRPVFLRLGSFALARGQDLDVGVLRVPRSGEVAIEMRGIDGSPRADKWCLLVSLDASMVFGAGRLVDGLVVFNVGPGSYLAQAEAVDCCFEHGPIDVRSGERTLVHLRAIAGVQRSLRCDLPAGSPSGCGILRKGGVPMRSFHLLADWLVCLSPGQWELELELAGGRKQRIPFEVTADAEAPPIEIRVPR